MYGFRKTLLLTGTVVCGFIVRASSTASAVVQRRQLMARALCAAIDTEWGEVLLRAAVRGAMVQYRDMAGCEIAKGSQSLDRDSISSKFYLLLPFFLVRNYIRFFLLCKIHRVSQIRPDNSSRRYSIIRRSIGNSLR